MLVKILVFCEVFCEISVYERDMNIDVDTFTLQYGINLHKI